ncbi:MAG TPA: bifunctional oligoribonuclease/PAP phosphatase NrnA [Acidimicrobiia bacterium]|nr:bifunctional oligoribonuclease/PAP phosphatase NrnA [Acidimicrobiia bacterium]
MIDRQLLEKAAAAITGSRDLALACHVGPDGDALGSMIGFGIAARNAGKGVVAGFGSPFIVPGTLSFLPDDLLVDPDSFPEAPETMVVFDAGSPDRLAELGSPAGDSGTLVVVDHHITNEGFGDIALVDPDAAATGVIVTELLDVLGWPITPDVAICLLTALVTDTGRFQYANTNPAALEMAARLVEAGARPDLISQKVYDEAPFGYLKVAGIALSRAELDVAARMVSTIITEQDLDEAGVGWGDIDNLINTLRLAEEADVAVLAKVHADGQVKLSLRSRGDTDVGALAAALSGGGHRLAAGLTFAGPAENAIDEVRARLEEYR